MAENLGESVTSRLTDYFRKIQERFVSQKKIEEYERGICWVEPPDPIFSLRKKLEPTPLYSPMVFIWAPHLLVDELLVCPDCGRKLGIKGWNKDPYARRVIDLNQ